MHPISRDDLHLAVEHVTGSITPPPTALRVLA
jgi:hypothetical protein